MSKVIFIFLLFIALAVKADIYKWLDKDGNTHFGDRPSQGAQKVELPPIQSYSAPPTITEETHASPVEANVRYQLKIMTPLPEATIRDNQGQINLTVSVMPELKAGHKIRIFVDGKPVIDTDKLETQISSVDRGAHTLQAQLIDGAGKIIASTETFTIYMHQAFIAPNKPKPKFSKK